jgi:hypothetical protein
LILAPKAKSEEDVQIVGERKNPSVNASKAGGGTWIKRKKTAGPSELPQKTGFQILDQARIGEALIAQKPFDDLDHNTSMCSFVVYISY